MFTQTTAKFLNGLRESGNSNAWRDLDKRFRPLLVGFARRMGLGPEDATDVAQETLTRFVGLYRNGGYRRSRGRLSSWIVGIARNCVIEQKRGRATRREVHGMSALASLPDRGSLPRSREADGEREALGQAIQALRHETRLDPGTIRVFECLVFEQISPAEVAVRMGVTLNDVYLAKHRCLKRLRPIIARLRSEDRLAN